MTEDTVRNAAPIPNTPLLQFAVVTCMDARLDVPRMLGIDRGEAHVIRNAGGIVTDDVLRSLVISQRLLGTRKIVLIRHTACGMLTFKDEQLREQLVQETGAEPRFPFLAFADIEGEVRKNIGRVAKNPFLVHRDVRGFIYDVETGDLREVEPA